MGGGGYRSFSNFGGAPPPLDQRSVRRARRTSRGAGHRSYMSNPGYSSYGHAPQSPQVTSELQQILQQIRREVAQCRKMNQHTQQLIKGFKKQMSKHLKATSKVMKSVRRDLKPSRSSRSRGGGGYASYSSPRRAVSKRSTAPPQFSRKGRRKYFPDITETPPDLGDDKDRETEEELSNMHDALAKRYDSDGGSRRHRGKSGSRRAASPMGLRLFSGDGLDDGYGDNESESRHILE